MTHADMADYFTRLRAAIPPAAQQAAAEPMEDDYAAEEGAATAAIHSGHCLALKKSQPGGIKKRTKLISSS